ncbi:MULTISPECIES: ABC transporter permease [unclassified Rathayibacter]|uniref:ABC transporter permease n=1 Tax=unclassified Rathayibacter TaxID=2609250 RepID=UPI001047D680|nr:MULTISPECIES: ABC transporter permease [unclassified Rathayibacter]MCJ1703758.1 ABC transporter permease [Rathayibacter sp. VKM Ac-2926]TCL82729.1 ribose transport system permease protein [Rathayibacter sp. PhB192]TCM28068.1 ribose transport system permease protein [Rathayibacter sp. PhB179]
MTQITSTAPAPVVTAKAARRIPSLLVRQEASLLGVVAVIVIAATLINPAFLTGDNITEILRSSVIYFVMACGAALLIIGGGLDFSVGAIFTLSALTGTSLMKIGVPIPLAILAALVIAALVGVLNHLIITYWHVPPIIATLGVFFVVLGANSLITGGLDVLPLPPEFVRLGQGYFIGIPNIIWIAVLVGIVTWFALEHTRFGVNIRALGGNRAAAVANGLHVKKLDLALYAIAAVTGGIAGLLYSARVGAGQVEAGGSATTLVVVTAVLIGGVSLLGGLGNITGVAIGAVLLSLIDNALIVSRIPPQFNNIVVGAILVCAVAVDHLRRQQLYKRR